MPAGARAECADKAKRQLPAAREDLPDLSRVRGTSSCVPDVSLRCRPIFVLLVARSTLHVLAMFIMLILAHQPSIVVHACNADPDIVPEACAVCWAQVLS